MNFYADYEALEFNSLASKNMGIYPYYLDAGVSASSLIPLILSVCNENAEVIYSRDCLNHKISFIDVLSKISENYNDTNTHRIYFHNLKYDFAIIKHELAHNGFKQVFCSEKLEYLTMEGYRLPDELLHFDNNTYTIAGKSFVSFTNITVYYNNMKFIIGDTMKILVTSQDKILQKFNKEPKIPIDFSKINLINLLEKIPQIKERNIYDITSLCECIEEFLKDLSDRRGCKGMTAPALALSAMRKALKIDSEKYFRAWYPILSGLNRDISRYCYSGGICNLNTKYKDKILQNINMVDINSSYPHSMTLDLPFGEGKLIDNNINFSEYSEMIVYISFKHNITPFQRCNTENSARRILNKDLLDKDKTYSRKDFPKEFCGYLCINSIDLETLIKFSEVKDLQIYTQIQYKTNTMLKDYIENLYEERRHATGISKDSIKLMLNSLYGKFAQDLSGQIDHYNGLNIEDKIFAKDNNPIFTPLASAVTAYSRRSLVNMINILNDDFIYGDTDSAYFINPDKIFKKLKKHKLLSRDVLGKWKREIPDTNISKAKFIGKKMYMYMDGKNKVVKCVGLNSKYHDMITFDNFNIGLVLEIEKMRNIYGGQAMKTVEFTVKERLIK